MLGVFITRRFHNSSPKAALDTRNTQAAQAQAQFLFKR